MPLKIQLQCVLSVFAHQFFIILRTVLYMKVLQSVIIHLAILIHKFWTLSVNARTCSQTFEASSLICITGCFSLNCVIFPDYPFQLPYFIVFFLTRIIAKTTNAVSKSSINLKKLVEVSEVLRFMQIRMKKNYFKTAPCWTSEVTCMEIELL